MPARQGVQFASDYADPTVTLRHLQGEVAWMPLPLLLVCGTLLIGGLVRFPDPVQGTVCGLLLYCVVLSSWAFRRVGYLASTWALVAGLLMVILLVAAWTGFGAALCLLTLPVGFAATSIGAATGLLVAMGCTAVLFLLPALGPFDQVLRATALLNVWGAAGLAWMNMHPLLTTLEWSWSSYEQSRSLLERARDTQVQLKQALEDLSDANVQLTRLNELAQSLRRAAEDARQAKNQFVANVSHELRTPLNMIIGYAEMMVRTPGAYGAVPGPLLADLRVIMRNSQHLSALIDDVLDLSKVDAGQMALSREQASVRDIIEAAVIAVKPLFGSKGLYLEMVVAEEMRCYCDSVRIREVMLNLLSNAGRFTEEGGVRIRAQREGSDALISVSDTGPGLGPSERKVIFQPFRQAANATQRSYGGTGLGLYISRSLVELHGGKMWLESEEGRGTTFWLRLPIERPPDVQDGVMRWLSPSWPMRQRHRRSAAPVPNVRPRYLVVEEGGALRKLVTRYWDSVEAIPVPGTDQVADELARTPARAVLLNSASTSEALGKARAVRGLPDGTPLIACSLPAPHEAANALGITDYLIKPVSRDALLAAVDRLSIQSGTVLIADDEPEAMQLFWRMLASTGRSYRVLSASDGRQALQMMHDEHPDLVLLDLIMPEMDGFRVLEARSEDPQLQQIPIIVTSACDPSGEPIIGDTLAVACPGGFSVRQLLACIEGLSATLSPLAPQAGPVLSGEHPC